MRALILTCICLFTAAGCAHTSAGAVRMGGSDRASLLRRQLAGHLTRARGCFTDARMHDPRAGAFVALGFTMRPDGRVSDVRVAAFSHDERMLAACVRSRIVSLYFDPAPPVRAIRIERTFAHCPDERDGFCSLGPVHGLEDRPAVAARLASIEAELASRRGALRACVERAGATEAVLDVRLELGPDGRIMVGQLQRSHPEGTPAARCGVGPLLGARVQGPPPDETLQLRYVYRIARAPSVADTGAVPE